ncbi:30S ribosomal protein S5 [Candidatus Karelsulcia muelleri]|uniref:30S ribosomal protein S5 n=1 Tax=Candidatus Karelsulcia muelleri TaxID=336810 RepID=UPI00216ADAA5|nr:30S ribosomal protein S5 [Candidatus Karelsulcia muelleri]
MTVLNKKIKLELKEKLVMVNRVCKVTKGRRYFSFTALVIKGDENGVVGYGLGKAKEAQDAIYKAAEKAKNKLLKINIIKGGTIPHEQEAKYGGARVLICPVPEGTGIIAGGAVRSVLEAVGLTNVLSKSKGSSNKINCIKATILALSKLRTVNTIALERGISISKILNGSDNY